MTDLSGMSALTWLVFHIIKSKGNIGCVIWGYVSVLFENYKNLEFCY